MNTRKTELKRKMAEMVIDLEDMKARNLPYDNLEAEFDSLAREYRAIEPDSGYHGSTRALTVENRVYVDNSSFAPSKNTNSGPATGNTGKTYRQMFCDGSSRNLDKGGFKNSEEFLNVIASGRHDERLLRASMTSGADSAGWAIPQDMAATWLDDSLSAEVVRPLATVFPMMSDERVVPAWDDFDRSTAGTTHGGLKMEILAETGTGTKQTAKVRNISMKARKGAIFVDCSREVMADGIDFSNQIQTAIKKSMSTGMDNEFINGSGASAAQGILASPALIQVAGETGQAQYEITFDNISKMYSRMYPAGRQRGVFIANSDCLPTLLQMNIALGAAGQPVFIPPNGAAAAPYGTLFGRPLVFSELMPSLGNANGNEIVFADLSQYYVGLRQEIVLDQSIAPGFLQDLVSFRAIVRFTGQFTWPKAITPPNSAASLSCVVGLQARA